MVYILLLHNKDGMRVKLRYLQVIYFNLIKGRQLISQAVESFRSAMARDPCFALVNMAYKRFFSALRHTVFCCFEKNHNDCIRVQSNIATD